MLPPEDGAGMGRDWLLNALAMCERHIALSNRLLADQEKRIAAREAGGLNVSDSRALLDTFEETHRLHVEHRDLIARQLATYSRRSFRQVEASPFERDGIAG